MMHKVGEKTYADTAFLNAIQSKVPGAEMKHLGYGEFYLQTPVGKVQFDRIRGVDFEGQDGRSHLVYGDAPAVELMLAHAEGC
jgi:hypothetical protein